MIAALAGFIAGSAHVVTGPDHLAALAPIAVDPPRKAMRIGLRWGLGHGLGVIILGALGVFARSAVDVDAISAWSEFVVGFALIAVGVWALRRTMKMVIHAHPQTQKRRLQWLCRAPAVSCQGLAYMSLMWPVIGLHSASYRSRY